MPKMFRERLCKDYIGLSMSNGYNFDYVIGEHDRRDARIGTTRKDENGPDI